MRNTPLVNTIKFSYKQELKKWSKSLHEETCTQINSVPIAVKAHDRDPEGKANLAELWVVVQYIPHYGSSYIAEQRVLMR